MNETNRSVTNLFTKESHHRDLSVVYIDQNLFNNGKEHRAISLNSRYIVALKNSRDASQIVHLAWQNKLTRGRSKLFKKHLKMQHPILSVICCWTSSSTHLTSSNFVQKFFQTRQHQNRHQEVVNRGLCVCAGGFTFVQGGLKLKIDKNSTDL